MACVECERRRAEMKRRAIAVKEEIKKEIKKIIRNIR